MPTKPRYVSTDEAFKSPYPASKTSSDKEASSTSSGDSTKKIQDVVEYIQSKLDDKEIVELCKVLDEATGENQDENQQNEETPNPGDETSGDESTSSSGSSGKAEDFSDEEMPS